MGRLTHLRYIYQIIVILKRQFTDQINYWLYTVMALVRCYNKFYFRQKADVFSLGITLYALVTGGRHPFDDYDFKSEMDRVVAEVIHCLNVLNK